MMGKMWKGDVSGGFLQKKFLEILLEHASDIWR